MKRLLIIATILAVLGAAAYLPLKDRGARGALREPLIVHFTGDVSGRLEPCGCFTGQFGGLTRLSTLLAAEGDDSLRLDTGNAIAGGEDYELLQYRYLTEAFARMDFVALNVGAREASLSIEQLRQIQGEAKVPLVCANLFESETGETAVDPILVHEHAGRRVAIVGVVDPDSVGDQLGDGLRIEAMETAIGNSLTAIDNTLADYTILLAFTSEARMRELARRFYEFDLILGGDVPQPSQELIRENDSVILYVTNQARAVGRYRAPDPSAPAGSTEGEEFSMTLLHDKIPQEPELIELSESYREFLRDVPLAIDDPEAAARLDDSRVPGSESPFTYVGSATCLACHQNDHAIWAASGHAHAFETLEKKGADADPNCIGCHTVGFGEPSGYRREFAGERLAGVGCESCHGPGSEHVAQRAAAHTDSSQLTFKFRTLGEADCTRCHYGEFSRPFDWAEFWPPVRHGETDSSAPVAGE